MGSGHLAASPTAFHRADGINSYSLCTRSHRLLRTQEGEITGDGILACGCWYVWEERASGLADDAWGVNCDVALLARDPARLSFPTSPTNSPTSFRCFPLYPKHPFHRRNSYPSNQRSTSEKPYKPSTSIVCPPPLKHKGSNTVLSHVMQSHRIRRS